jgi:hypothetical protein
VRWKLSILYPQLWANLAKDHEQVKNDSVPEINPSSQSSETQSDTENPPLPLEELPPPLPDEAPPVEDKDDGWEPVWDGNNQAYYFYNRLTGATQWDNPRVPDATQTEQSGATIENKTPKPRPHGGYDPSIHGDYDPNASYAVEAREQAEAAQAAVAPQTNANPATDYSATATFNRFTGKWQSSDVRPENFSDDSKSKRQMSAFFDVDAAANNHDGRSLKAERSAKKLSKQELKAFKEKRREKKEEKRRAWLRD